jgi:pimeloyl-ACP methyl ester carboxylesterase
VNPYYHQGQHLTADGAPLWYEVRGEGEQLPAVFCDGLGCDGFIWKYLWEPVTRDRQVMHFNYRGHGKSGVPADDTRIGVEYLCDDLEALMDRAGMKRAIVFGHSMGVQVALEYHRRHRARVAGLVLLCGSYGTPLDTWHDHSLLRLAFPKLRAVVERLPGVAQRLTAATLGTSIALEFGVRTELNPTLIRREDFAPYMEHLATMHPLYFIRTLDSLKDHSAWDHLPAVDVPSLVVGGEIDRFTPVWLSERMAAHLPGSERLIVPGGSHTAPLERIDLVNDTVMSFLSRRLPAR